MYQSADGRGRGSVMRHDYVRHGTTTLFSALNNSRRRGRRAVRASCSTSTSRSADKTRMRQVAEALIALSRYPMASPPPMSPLTPSPWTIC